MPWKVNDVVEQRIEFVARALMDTESFSATCREFGISRPTGYLWLRRYHEVKSFSKLKEQSRRPKCSPGRTRPDQEELVKAIRERYGWGGEKIQLLLQRDYGVQLGVRTVNRILKRCGLISPEESHRRATKRFEKERPNELWQVDFKGDYPTVEGRCYPLSILDDHSRYAMGLFALPRPGLEQVQGSLIGTFERYGVPEAMLMDHGSPWWSTTNGHGLTRLTVALIKQGIRLKFSGVRHPQTQGKVERFHRTLDKAMRRLSRPQTLREWSAVFDRFVYEYNQIRPHQALHMLVPAQKYQPAARAYDPGPGECEYPSGAVIKRLNTQGRLYYGGRYYFVCEALADERIWLRQIGDKMLITYRHMHVREIDLKTGRSCAIVRPAEPTSDMDQSEIEA
ncbi:MAG TPA: IS481 family transposase [Acidobacteriota bacterium]